MKYGIRWSFGVLLALWISTGTAQSLMQQAIALRTYIDTLEGGRYYFTSTPERGPECMAALATALGLAGPEVALDDILDRLKGNPFLGGEETGTVKVVLPDEYESLAPAFSKTRPAGPGRTQGFFSVSTIADGLAKFLVTRTKQELSIAFFEDFQKAVRQNPHISTLFPATSLTLGAIGDKIYQFDNYLNDLRQSFDKDMRVLPASLKTYVVTQDLFKKPYRQILAEDILDLSQAIVNKTPADTILMILATQTALQQPARLREVDDAALRARLENLASGFQVVNLFSQSLRSPGGKGIWYSRADLENALRDDATLYLYLGLLWQAGGDIHFGKDKSFRNILAGLTTYDQLRSNLRNFSVYGQEVFNGQQAYAQFRKDNPTAEADAVPYEPFYTFCNGLFGLIETGTQFKMQFAGIVGENTRFDTVFLSTLRHLNDLNYDVHARLYASAVNDVVLVLDQLLDKDFAFRAPLLKYGRFIANVAEADNSDEVAKAIDAVALPPGSARMKKEARWSVSLNGYVGAAAGQERLDRTKTKSLTAALSAPVGVAFNRGFGGKQSLSLFVPVLDVGAIAAFRFNDPAADDLPELKWSNLFSPGAYLVWGFQKKWPLVIGLGAQRGPNLRKINSDLTPDITQDSGWRYGGFIAVDIPVFNFFAQ